MARSRCCQQCTTQATFFYFYFLNPTLSNLVLHVMSISCGILIRGNLGYMQYCALAMGQRNNIPYMHARLSKTQVVLNARLLSTSWYWQGVNNKSTEPGCTLTVFHFDL